MYRVYVKKNNLHLLDCTVALANLYHYCLTYDRFSHDSPQFIVFLIGSNGRKQSVNALDKQ